MPFQLRALAGNINNIKHQRLVNAGGVLSPHAWRALLRPRLLGAGVPGFGGGRCQRRVEVEAPEEGNKFSVHGEDILGKLRGLGGMGVTWLLCGRYFFCLLWILGTCGRW